MAKLSKAARETAHELLRWDEERVVRFELARPREDTSVYRGRQRKVASALDAGLPAERWPVEVRDVLMALLEHHMSLEAHPQFKGPEAAAAPPRTPEELEALRVLARELGVYPQLHEVAPLQWPMPAEEKKE